MHHNHQQPKEKQEADKIVALKESDGLQRDPQSQEEHDQDRARGKFQKESWHSDDRAPRDVFFAPVSPARFPEEWSSDQQDPREAAQRADERAVRGQRGRGT